LQGKKTDMQSEKILVIGSNGQIGTELVEELRKIYGTDNVIASDIKKPGTDLGGPFEILNVLDKTSVEELILKKNVTQVYLLAALLSATAERNVHYAWQLNMEGLILLLDMARDKKIKKLYWPSSIAVFGPSTPRKQTPQHTVMDPTTVYGISKLAGERWCEYYHLRYGVDVRSLRYPGLIGYKSAPGGGTTDYAVHIFHEALRKGSYTSFLSEDTYLPMMYMPDAIRATISLMESPSEKIGIRSSYNIAGVSFSPKELAAEIRKHLPGFRISYAPDSRQNIADSWPQSIDDSVARSHWGWTPEYDLPGMTRDMLENIKAYIQVNG
jgi:nucleoside-diphosphate-sugar epimerase